MNTSKYIWIAALGLMTAGFASCSDDDGNPYPDGGGQLNVSQVYLMDVNSSVPERPVDFARLGQTLRLSGQGFAGVRKVYVNGYETYFNTALMTNESMVISLSGNTPITSADADVRNKIQFVKADGSIYSCDLVIMSSSPSISRISPALPKAGQTVYVYGAGLDETSKVVLPDGTEITSGIENASDDEAGKWFSFVMPDGVTMGGSITTTGANGTAISSNYFNFGDCMILDFDGTGAQGFWSWKEDGSMLNDEDLADDPLGINGKCCQIVPERLMGKANYNKSRFTECWSSGDGDDRARNWGWMNEFIPAETSTAEMAFQFDVYCPEEWSNSGQIEITFNNNVSWTGYGSDETKSATTFCYVWTPWLNDDNTATPYKTDGWVTVTIPLSKFSMNVSKDTPAPISFQELIDWRVAASYPNVGMGFCNTNIKISEGVEFESYQSCTPKIYTDNWRIVPMQSFTVSDFPDDEEDAE